MQLGRAIASEKNDLPEESQNLPQTLTSLSRKAQSGAGGMARGLHYTGVRAVGHWGRAKGTGVPQRSWLRKPDGESLLPASLLRHGESFDEEAPGPCGLLAERCNSLIGGRSEPVPSRLEGWKNDNCRSRGRPVQPFQGDDRCPERDQPSSKRRESGFELFVIGLKSCWVMNLDEGDKIGRHSDCGFEWGRLIGHGFDFGLD